MPLTRQEMVDLQLQANARDPRVSTAAKTIVASGWEEYERIAQELWDNWPECLSTQKVIDAIRR